MAAVVGRGTTSQLDRSDFQSIMGACEGAFSAEPAAGDHPRGDWGGPGSRWLATRPTRPCQTWLCSGKWVRLAAGGEHNQVWWRLLVEAQAQGPPCD
jgi:hypothetical protein